MLRDKTVIWVLEYIFGAMLVVVPLAGLFFVQTSLMDSRVLAVELFVVCLGVILIACASSMRQRMLLRKRINTLAEQITSKF